MVGAGSGSREIADDTMANAEIVGQRKLVRKNRKRRVTVSNGAEKVIRPVKNSAADCVRSLRPFLSASSLKVR